jgi:hypothetical protein
VSLRRRFDEVKVVIIYINGMAWGDTNLIESPRSWVACEFAEFGVDQTVRWSSGGVVMTAQLFAEDLRSPSLVSRPSLVSPLVSPGFPKVRPSPQAGFGFGDSERRRHCDHARRR